MAAARPSVSYAATSPGRARPINAASSRRDLALNRTKYTGRRRSVPGLRPTGRLGNVRIVTAAEAVAGISSGQQLYLQCAAATPSVLLDALVARAAELSDVSVVHLHCEGPGPHLAPEMAPHFRHKALFIGPNARAAIADGRADYIPTFLSDVPRLFDGGLLPLDAVFVNATPPDAHGFCSLGTSVEAMHAAIRAARQVIVQFNAAMPRTLGDSFIHVSQVDLAIECDVPPYEHPVGTIGEVERRIGEYVAELVPDGATLQLGIGAIPAATAMALRDKRDLGVHTEMFTDSIVDLVEAGVVTGARKERNRGKIVTAFLMGSKRLYDFVDDNPMVEMRPVDFTNDTHVIRSFSRMVAINSAIEVDLGGQVVADSIGHRLYSGVGGQMDFIRGAGLASEGRAIIALPSTARGGASRIVSSLREGAGVVTTRAHVRTVVTEWGVAELFGKSLRERAVALISIAHPDVRETLIAETRALYLG
jgi:4-hydroxybutyrate CoA-transferase